MAKIYHLITIFIFFALSLSTGCSPTIYGVPEEEWSRMSEEQKQLAIHGYNERKRIQEQQRLEAARREAHEERERQERIEALHRGETGVYGDLVRIRIQGGEMKIDGEHRRYEPVSFTIANGEVRNIEIVNEEHKRHTHREELVVSYNDGVLLIDADDPDKALRLVYDRDWKTGKSYISTSRGRLRMHSVEVLVEIVPPLHRR